MLFAFGGISVDKLMIAVVARDDGRAKGKAASNRSGGGSSARKRETCAP
jgi:hypothetical protein